MLTDHRVWQSRADLHGNYRIKVPEFFYSWCTVLCDHTSELAIRAALFLALQPPGKLTPVREIAKGTGLSEPYLAKIIQRLTSAGLVRAFRGPGGGIELGRAPQAITLASIVSAMQGHSRSESCVLGLRGCSEENPCPLHHQWAPIRAEIQRLLEETTLATLTDGLRERLELGQKSWLRLGAEPVRRSSRESQTGKAS